MKDRRAPDAGRPPALCRSTSRSSAGEGGGFVKVEASQVTKVRTIIRDMGDLLVAFSGGVDSTVVLKLAIDELGTGRVLAVTAHGDVHTSEELERSQKIASQIGARHVIVDSHELEVPGFSANPPGRCYLCRGAMYARMWELARQEGLGTVVDGANQDDSADYRPGLRAAKSQGVRSPLTEAGLGKDEVRALARDLGLTNWDLPSTPCLSSRFPYGEQITTEKLRMVAEAERHLRGLGFATARVRHHGGLARIEVLKDDLALVAEEPIRGAIVGYLHELGYTYVTLDLEGFRSGSMNETLQPALRRNAAEEEND